MIQNRPAASEKIQAPVKGTQNISDHPDPIKEQHMSQNFVIVSAKPSLAERRYGTQRDYILLDRSSSMEGKWNEALAAVNTYVRTLMKVKTKITAAVFDDQYQIVRQDIAPTFCAPITNDDAVPRGGTALNDSIGKLVAQAKQDNPEMAVIVIMTDGEENCSRELTDGQANALLTQCRLRGWQVIFLGIDHDNTKLAQQYGASPHQFIAARKQALAATMQKAAEKRAAYSQTGKAISFTEVEKKDAGKSLLR
jgi:hypothetical protein